MRQVVLDTETTGLKTKDGHRVIEIGCVELSNRRLTGKTYHQYINPQRDIDEGAINVHGITNQFLADKPLFTDIVDEFILFIKDAELVIHNAAFDVGFLNYEFKLAKRRLGNVNKYCQVFDTLTLARSLHPGQRNSLDALCKRYEIDNSQRELHGALLDAEILAQVYLAMTSGQESLFIDNVNNAKQTNDASDSAQAIEAVQKTHLTTPVIAATKEELMAHEQQLQAIQQASKQCLWLAEEGLTHAN